MLQALHLDKEVGERVTHLPLDLESSDEFPRSSS